MSKYIAILLLFIVQTTLSQGLFITSGSSVKFTSDAPLEMIQASSEKLLGVINIKDKSFVFRVPMNTFNGFNSSLQKTHFNSNYLETEKYPHTIFEGKIIEDIDLKTPGTYKIRGKGRFTCHGIEAERIIKCKIIVSPNRIKITSEFTVFLEDHNIKIPSVVHQKIAEEITISLNIELTKK